jgi:hypothetical protein
VFLHSEAKSIRPARGIARNVLFGFLDAANPTRRVKRHKPAKCGQIRGDLHPPLRAAELPFIGTYKRLILEPYFPMIAFRSWLLQAWHC